MKLFGRFTEKLNTLLSSSTKSFVRCVALLLMFASLLTSASVAWIVFNKQADSEGMDMSLVVDDTTASYLVYMYDTKLEKGVTEINGVPIDITSIDFNQYDTIFKSRNKYTPVFAKIEIVRVNSMPRSGTVTATVKRSNISSSTEFSEHASSVMRFTGLISTLNDSDPAKLYTNIEALLYNEVAAYGLNYSAPDSKTFTTATLGQNGEYTYSKEEEITLTLTYKESDWLINGDGNEFLNFYLYMTYDGGLVNRYQTDNNMTSIVLEESVVEFANDFSEISVSYQK